jgi:hypothetical protein
MNRRNFLATIIAAAAGANCKSLKNWLIDQRMNSRVATIISKPPRDYGKTIAQLKCQMILDHPFFASLAMRMNDFEFMRFYAAYKFNNLTQMTACLEEMAKKARKHSDVDVWLEAEGVL